MRRKNAGFIVQVRLNSTRLPGKALLRVCGAPLLEHLFRRVEASGLTDHCRLTVATSTRDKDIAAYCEQRGVPCFMGREKDVTRRLIDAAEHFGFDYFFRLQGDDPLVCPFGLQNIFKEHIDGRAEITTTGHRDGWPLGTSAMILETQALKREYGRSAGMDKERLLQGFLSLTTERFDIRWVRREKALCRDQIFVTVDYPEDIEVLRAILRHLKPAERGYDFSLDDICGLFETGMVKAVNAHLHEPFEPVGQS